MVRGCNKICKTCQANREGHSARREKKRQTEEEMGGQHPIMDGHDPVPRQKKLRGERNGGSWLPDHLCRPNGPPDYGIGDGEVKIYYLLS